MWLVAKIKTRELKFFEIELKNKFGEDTKFYSPKIYYQKFFKNKLKKFESYVLDNYVFCFNKKFFNLQNLNSVQNIRGLKYFLSGFKIHQQNIVNFIDNCKSFENKDGYLNSNFFNLNENKNAKFMSGPFTDVFFKILNQNKNKINILLGDIPATISNNNKYFYKAV